MRITLIVLFVLFVVIPCKADMFTHHKTKNIIIKKNPQYSVRKAGTTNLNRSNVFSEKKENDIRHSIKTYISRHPEYFKKTNACQCSSCKANNVYFYFLENNFTAQDILHAIALAKSHNLNPIINIETNKNLQTKSDFIREFYKIKNKIPSVNSEMSLEHSIKIINKIKSLGGGGYFKFDSIDGLKLGGKIERFNHLYNIAFGK